MKCEATAPTAAINASFNIGDIADFSIVDLMTLRAETLAVCLTPNSIADFLGLPLGLGVGLLID